MNDADFQEWRALQIAIVILFRYYKGISIEKSDNTMCDLIIKDTSGGTLFGVEVGGKWLPHQQTFDTYKNKLNNAVYNGTIPTYPLIVMRIDEERETAEIAMLTVVKKGRVYITCDCPLMEVNKENMVSLWENIKCMGNYRNTIPQRPLIMKNLLVHDNREGCEGDGWLVYLREMKENYEIGHSNYPEDILDKIILRAAKKNGTLIGGSANTSMTTYEYKKIKRFAELRKQQGEIRIVPDVSTIPQNLMPIIGNTLEGIRIKVEIYLNEDANDNAFNNFGFTQTMYVSNDVNSYLKKWTEQLAQFEYLTKTMHTIEEI